MFDEGWPIGLGRPGVAEYPADALSCQGPTQFHNDWEDQKLYAKAALFAETEFLGWSTEV